MIDFPGNRFILKASKGNTALLFCQQRPAHLQAPGFPSTRDWRKQACGFLCDMMTKEIPLTMNRFAIIDDDDFDLVSKHTWRAYQRGKTFYARNGNDVYMHRLIMNAPDGIQIDHRDGDGLNCTRDNLRFATPGQNQANLINSKQNISGYKGVDLSYGKWRARITLNGKGKVLGYFDNPEEAARAYDIAAREAFGEFAKTNFD